jgi:4-hydroxybenzoate polyprenyltransferase
MVQENGRGFAMPFRLVKAEDVLIVAVAIYLAAVLAAGGKLPSFSLNLILALLYGMCGVAGVNSLNQIHDVKIDAVNKPLRPLPSKSMSEKSVAAISVILLTVGAVCAIILFFTLSYIYVVLGLLGLFTSLVYTLPTTRFKRFTMLSTGIMGFGYGPFIFLAGWTLIADPLDAPLWVLGFLYFHEVFILITKDYRDMDGDERYGMRTLPVVMGRKRAAVVNYTLYILPFTGVAILSYLGFINYNPYLLVPAGYIIGLPMFWFCSRPKLLFNIAGYYVYIIAFILIRLILVFTY